MTGFWESMANSVPLDGSAMHVIQVAAINPIRVTPGGIRTHVLGLSGALARRGIEVTIVGAGPGGGSNFGGIDFVSVADRFPLSSPQFLKSLLWASRRLPLTNRILHVHRPDDLAAFLMRRDIQARFLTVHGLSVPGVQARHGPGTALAYRIFEALGLQMADRIIVLDEDTERGVRRLNRASTGKIVRDGSGVDLELFVPRARDRARELLGIPNIPTVAYVGRFASEKNLSLLIESFEDVPEAQLIMAGDGPERARLERLAATRPRIRVLGPFGRETIAQVLNAADVLALPSEREALPAVALEALACGTPVVATPVGAMRELLNGQNGFISPASRWEFSRQLKLALERSESMRTACRKSVLERGWDAVAARIVKLYEEVAA